MRKITKLAALSFCEGSPRKFKNTEVIRRNPSDPSPIYSMLLHGNKIAERGSDGVWLSLHGWNTITTRERLNGLLSHMGAKFRFAQRKGEAVIVTQDGLTQRVCDWQFHSLDELNSLSVRLDNERARQYA